MVPSAVETGVFVICAALVIDRLAGDPHTSLHPVALLGRFIGWWGRPGRYRPKLQRFAGIVFWCCSVALFALPFYCFASFSPLILYLILGPVLLKSCLAWRSLEEHTRAVVTGLGEGVEEGRKKVRMLVSRPTDNLGRNEILSAGYESFTENITDSIISPLFYFSILGLGGSAAYRAANTMDAMLGYRDERRDLGWASARMDDILNFIPARITVLLLLLYFIPGRRFSDSVRVLRRDGYKRPGFNGGLVMAAMAGGTGARFEKPGLYIIGNGERTLEEAGTDILSAGRFVVIAFAFLACCALFLLGSVINSTGI